MNSIILMGRLTGDPELRVIQGNSELTVTRFSIAVNRKYKAANEEKPKTDFFSCVAWGKTGEFINKYFKKGNRLTGNRQLHQQRRRKNQNYIYQGRGC